MDPLVPPLPSQRSRRTRTLWVALVLLCSVIIGVRLLERWSPATHLDPAELSSPLLKMYGRFLLGTRALEERFGGEATSPAAAGPIVEALGVAATGPAERLRIIPLVAEASGVDDALSLLDEFEKSLAFDADADEALRRDAAALRAIYTADDPSASLDDAQRDEFLSRHHWFARLALSHGMPETDPARRAFAREGLRTMVVMLMAGLVLVVAGLTGAVLFIVALVLLATRQLRVEYPLARSLPIAMPSGRPVYLESFALFLAALVGAQVGGGLVAHVLHGDPTLILLCLTPLAILWPMVRGVRWREVRAAVGLTRGQGVLTEMTCGVAGHLAGIPILLLGLMLSVLIIQVLHTDASHPMTRDIDPSRPASALMFLLLAAVWAPLVEETFFRGALYHHLRGRWPVIPASLLVGLVFAVIHPQGIGGVPVLTALGMNFCLIREWRGSLIAPITAHALHNGFITLMLILFLF